ncbi:DUF167 domain-containing protein [Hymenobacter negativus]|uniref:UPF0235 protein J4E00_11495 n=1 Tax=Hymenobacter negativus TaxID=2795026 RepID=A0ABS3QEK2_9BACT|nr:DUF167 domain-containing protein [Hymenobacter negativus]MBO2009677.1 DUF167 domain-containing protein [Hymenobacter negativus]
MAILHLKAKPGSRINQLLIGPDGTAVVRLNAPAQEGKANAALQAYLATTFGIAKNRVTLLAGHTSPFKKVELADVSNEQLQQVLARLRSAVD